MQEAYFQRSLSVAGIKDKMTKEKDHGMGLGQNEYEWLFNVRD